MAGENRPRQRYGEAFWRAHHEAWRRSELNQREYCEAQGIPLKAFGNWRAKFKAEPQPPEHKLLYRRGSLSHTVSHGLSHPISHMTFRYCFRPSLRLQEGSDAVLPVKLGGLADWARLRSFC